MDKIKKVGIDIDDLTRAQIVRMILEKQTEKALEKLSEFYHVTSPQIVVGTIKGKRRTVYALYVQKERKIYALNSDIFFNPFVVLHEYYHHIRTKLGVHRGSERNANKFAQEFVNAYKKIVRNGLIEQK
ncbi:MAG TPA: hypothetical protein VK431_06790 [Nitrosopumilaceae archaeon]|nr:hypothetical protein [Nitrosopumilaceae archaeon]